MYLLVLFTLSLAFVNCERVGDILFYHAAFDCKAKLASSCKGVESGYCCEQDSAIGVEAYSMAVRKSQTLKPGEQPLPDAEHRSYHAYNVRASCDAHHLCALKDKGCLDCAHKNPSNIKEGQWHDFSMNRREKRGMSPSKEKFGQL